MRPVLSCHSGRGQGGWHAAFTLIELLVVISILAMLTAILLPTLQRVRNQARAMACQAKLRQWGILYSAQLAQGEPIMGRRIWQGITTNDGKLAWWDERERYFGPQVQGLLFCPMASRVSDRITGKSVTGGDTAVGSTFAAWWLSSDKWKTVAASYGINNAVETVGSTSDEDVSKMSRPDSTWWSDAVNGQTRASIPVMLDCTAWWTAGVDWKGPPPYADAPLGGWHETCINRHDGGVNDLFLDWSVRKIGLKELWMFRWQRDFDTAGPWTKAGGVQPEDWPAWMRRFKDY